MQKSHSGLSGWNMHRRIGSIRHQCLLGLLFVITSVSQSWAHEKEFSELHYISKDTNKSGLKFILPFTAIEGNTTQAGKVIAIGPMIHKRDNEFCDVRVAKSERTKVKDQVIVSCGMGKNLFNSPDSNNIFRSQVIVDCKKHNSEESSLNFYNGLNFKLWCK